MRMRNAKMPERSVCELVGSYHGVVCRVRVQEKRKAGSVKGDKDSDSDTEDQECRTGCGEMRNRIWGGQDGNRKMMGYSCVEVAPAR